MAVLFLLNDETMGRGRERLVLFFFKKESCMQSLSNIKGHGATELGVSCSNPFLSGYFLTSAPVALKAFLVTT